MMFVLGYFAGIYDGALCVEMQPGQTPGGDVVDDREFALANCGIDLSGAEFEIFELFQIARIGIGHAGAIGADKIMPRRAALVSVVDIAAQCGQLRGGKAGFL